MRSMTSPDLMVRAGAKAPPLKPDLVTASLFMLTFMGISRAHQMWSWIGKLHPGNLFVGLAILGLAFGSRKVAKDWSKRLQAKLLLGMLLATLGSIAFGISQGGAFYALKQNYMSVLVLSALLMCSMRDVKDLRIIIWSFVAGCTMLVYMALFVFRMRNEGAIDRLAGMYTWDSNDIGLLLVTGLPLAMILFRTGGVKTRLFTGAGILGSAAAIAMTGSRGAFLALGSIMVVYLFSQRGTSVISRIVMAVVLVAGLVVAAPEGYWEQMNTITNAKEDYNWDAASGRRQLAKRGLQYMMERPLFGLGLNQFGRAEGTISDIAIARNGEGIKWSATHNSYLQAGAELGVPGFLIFTTIVLGGIVIPFRLRKQIPNAWQKGDWEQRFLFQAVMLFPLSALGFSVAGFFVSFGFNDCAYFLLAVTGAIKTCVDVKIAERNRPGNAMAPTFATGRQRRPFGMPQGRFGRAPVAARSMH